MDTRFGRPEANIQKKVFSFGNIHFTTSFAFRNSGLLLGIISCVESPTGSSSFPLRELSGFSGGG